MVTNVAIVAITCGTLYRNHDLDSAFMRDKGKKQITEAVRQHLKGRFFASVYSGDFPRASQTAQLTMETISGRPFPFMDIQQREKLCIYEYPEPKLKKGHVLAYADISTAEEVTVGKWLEWAPRVMLNRKIECLTGISRVAQETAAMHGNGASVLIGTDHLYCELISPYSESTPTLGWAGIIEYSVKVSANGKIKIAGARVIAKGQSIY